MENSPRSHQQNLRRSHRISKLPRQADMDDRSASPPSAGPRKIEMDSVNRLSCTNNMTATSTPFGDHDGRPLCISPVEHRTESPPATSSPPPTSPTSEQRSSPPPPPPPPPAAAATNNDPSEDESIALARMLMAQEAMESYALSADYLRYNSAEYSQEDLEALQAALDDEEDEGEYDDDDQDGGNDGLQYDMMLRLGEAIGDVKQERWKLKADEHIAKLPTFLFVSKDVEHLDENDSRCKCLVCQFTYEESESIRKMPCGHCFHTECVDQWLKEKDCCPYCRQPIVE